MSSPSWRCRWLGHWWGPVYYVGSSMPLNEERCRRCQASRSKG